MERRMCQGIFEWRGGIVKGFLNGIEDVSRDRV